MHGVVGRDVSTDVCILFAGGACSPLALVVGGLIPAATISKSGLLSSKDKACMMTSYIISHSKLYEVLRFEKTWERNIAYIVFPNSSNTSEYIITGLLSNNSSKPSVSVFVRRTNSDSNSVRFYLKEKTVYVYSFISGFLGNALMASSTGIEKIGDITPDDTYEEIQVNTYP